MNFFSDFKISFLRIKKGSIRYRKAGSGPPILMLHGNPQTHVMWHKVSPELVIIIQLFVQIFQDMVNLSNLHYHIIMRGIQKFKWRLIC